MTDNPSAYDQILSSLGDSLGMELSFADDTCNLLIDGKWSLAIVKIPAESRIVLSCVVLETLPEEIGYTTLTDMLGYALNPMFGTGPAVGIDTESDTLIAYVSVHLSQFEAEEFPAITAQFMEFVFSVSTRFNTDMLDEHKDKQVYAFDNAYIRG